jgi:hypothetical protein
MDENMNVENTEAVRRSLAELIEIKGYSQSGDTIADHHKGIVFKLDPDVWFIVQEHIVDENQNIINVIPTQYDELSKLRKNPFRGPSKDRILRIDYKDNSVILFIGDNNIDLQRENYVVTFVKQPEPIILEDLDTSLSINDKHNASTC